MTSWVKVQYSDKNRTIMSMWGCDMQVHLFFLKMVKIQGTFSDACIAAKSIIGISMQFSLTHTVLVPLCEVSKDLPLGPYYSKKRFYNKKQSQDCKDKFYKSKTIVGGLQWRPIVNPHKHLMLDFSREHVSSTFFCECAASRDGT